tara:strand:+ start:28 stop:381 length:354 start_codon:yes stop_codon:yes gene_type:complete
MKRFIAKKLQSSWRWVHKDIFHYEEDAWCEKFGTVIEKPKKYDWVEIEKKKLRNSDEIVDWYLYKTYKYNRIDDKIRRFFNLACMNYRTGKHNRFWQDLCHSYERFVDNAWDYLNCR